MPSLTATYASPTGTQTFTQDLPSSTSSQPSTSPHPTESTSGPSATENSTAERTAYLAALASSLKTLQADLNAFLTQKMEDDKLAADDASDKKAEEEYGEEAGEVD